MKQLNFLLRAAYGFSAASFRVLLARGPGAARKVMGSTLAAAHEKLHPDELHHTDIWNLARGFGTDGKLTVPAGSWMDGTTAPLERYLIALMLHSFKPRRVLEIGTYRGTTTRLMLDNLTADARVYTMDLPVEVSAATRDEATDERLIKHRKVGIDYLQHPLAGNVTQVWGDSFEEAPWRQVPDGIDFAFIDASHSYEAVKNDSERAFKKLGPDGVVLWHDYSEGESAERGVGRYIREQMRVSPEIFICDGTDVALRVPLHRLKEAAARLPAHFPDGDYSSRHPDGPFPWLKAG